MKNKILWKTNILICSILIVGFLLTFILSYRANFSAATQNIEHVSTLTSEGIYYQMHNILAKPVNVSLAMANDRLLEEVLLQEKNNPDNPACEKKLGNYLNGYQKAYDYDSVFLVSAATSRYYNFNGLDRVLKEGDPENEWYYQGMLQSEEECSINVDNDEAEGAENAITLFVNCKIYTDEGDFLGVVGVGVQIGYLQEILEDYHEEFDVDACFVDGDGLITLSATHNGYEKLNFFEENEFSAKEQENIQSWKKDTDAFGFWKTDITNKKNDYIVVRYVSDVSWHLIVESDTAALMARLHGQFIITILVLVILVIVILFITTSVIGGFNRKIVELTYSHEQERKTMFEKATEQLFEDIYELDITNNRPANKETEDYCIRMGAPAGASYDECLKIIADKQIHSEFRKDYVNVFSTENVLRTFEHGVDSFIYDFMITSDGKNYYWMRITARLIVSDSDGSLHMLTYRQNIDEEKKREQKMRELASRDEMTGFLNKLSAQRKMENVLSQNRQKEFAFFIFDIDRFKEANDLFGHAFGDSVIRKFASILCESFEEDALIGRIGGDEFAVLMKISDKESAVEKARMLKEALNLDYRENLNCWHISASIGVALAPRDGDCFDALYHRADEALYETKRRGRGDFTLYGNL